MRWKAGAVAASVALIAAGCGGGGAGDASAVVTSYIHALLRHDGAAACGMLSRTTKTAYEQRAGGKRCAPTLTAESRRLLTGDVRRRLEQARVIGVKVTGGMAAATVAVPGKKSTISLVKEGGGWRIESPIG